MFIGFQVLHNHIAGVEKLPLSTAGSPLLIKYKTFQSLSFVFSKEKDCQELYTTLCRLSRLSKN